MTKQRASERVDVATWRGISRRLYRRLRSHGMSVDDAQDIVQETAARVIAADPPEDPRELLLFSHRVVTNQLIDRARRAKSSPAITLLGDTTIERTALDDDVERRVEHRDELRAVADVMADELSPAEHTEMIQTIRGDDSTSRAESVRRSVARSRARAKIAARVEHLPVALGIPRAVTAVRAARARVTAARHAARARMLALSPDARSYPLGYVLSAGVAAGVSAVTLWPSSTPPPRSSPPTTMTASMSNVSHGRPTPATPTTSSPAPRRAITTTAAVSPHNDIAAAHTPIGWDVHAGTRPRPDPTANCALLVTLQTGKTICVKYPGR